MIGSAQHRGSPGTTSAAAVIRSDSESIMADAPADAVTTKRKATDPGSTVSGDKLVLDCGSGGTRIWRMHGKSVRRVQWPGGAKPPVLSMALVTAAGRREFAAGIRALHSQCFIGATAGVRHALQRGSVTENDLAALRAELPGGCELAVLTPIEEARYELKALRIYADDASCAMLSMGGKSMQCGREESLFSLPFAMHLGFDLLQRTALAVPWRARVEATAAEYERRCTEAAIVQALEPLDGRLIGVTDLVDMARLLKLADQPPLSKARLLQVLDECMHWYAARPDAAEGANPSVSNVDVTLLARALALRAVAARLMAETATIQFPSGFAITWTEGYLHS